MFDCCSLAFITLTVGLLLTRWEMAAEEKRQAREKAHWDNGRWEPDRNGDDE